MGVARWLRWIGPGVVALGAIGAIASATAGAGARPWSARPCPGSSGVLAAEARSTAPLTPAAVRGAPWFRLDPDLDADGGLRGQVLSVGTIGDQRLWTLALPAESFAAGPFGRIVLVGSDDGKRSHLEALDAGGDCSWSIGESTDVIRRATIDPTGGAVFEMRVARVGRADLGVWRRSLADPSASRLVLGPPAPDPRFGRTFSTEFTWDASGDRLAVQSCGEPACRTRLLSATGEPAGSIEDPGLGGLLGLDGDQVVTYAACRGLPCPIWATDVRTGAQRLLVPDGGPAVVATTTDGRRLVDEVIAGGERRLRATGLVDGATTDLGAIPAELGLVQAVDRSGSATSMPAGWILLAPDGRLPTAPSAPRPVLRRLSDGLSVPFDEATR